MMGRNHLLGYRDPKRTGNPVVLAILMMLFVCPLASFAHDNNPEPRRTKAIRTNLDIRVDGKLDESAWEMASPTSDFTLFQPVSGPLSSEKTEVSFLYDDRSIYIGARLHDPKPDSIMRQLSPRDAGSEANADLFGVAFDTYRDHQNAFWFMVSAAGVQSDTRISALGQDPVWDAVWNSAVGTFEGGWTVEMEIPYSALRFSSVPVQDWGLQVERVVRRRRETHTWNPMDRKVDGLVNQFGVLEGLENVKPPLRLSVTPYLSAYLQRESGGGLNPQNRSLFSAGADLKLGLSEGFTLDLTLVPDFGQVVADNQILNLTPFEVQFKENRQFFTEGTELFNIGDVFYSRRVGGTPRFYGAVWDSLRPGEVLVSNPDKSRLLNAFKLSGRTKGKTGLGIFNGMTAPVMASVNSNGESRDIMTQDFTNYNVLVADQNLNNNSYVSLINTNRLEANGYVDNVTAARLRLADNQNTYFFNGTGAISQQFRPDGNPNIGGAFNYKAGKGSGNLTYEVGQVIETDTYDPTGMGFLQSNNEATEFASIQYRHLKQAWKFVTIAGELSVKRTSLFRPYQFSSLSINGTTWFQTQDFDFFGGWAWLSPTEGHDFFEPRVRGRVLNYPGGGGFGCFISTNYARRFAIDLNYDFLTRPEWQVVGHTYSIQPRLRLGDRFAMNHLFRHNLSYNEYGFAAFDSLGNSLIGFRDRVDVENILSVEYTFTNKMAMTFRARHVWSGVQYQQMNRLLDDGSLLAFEDTENRDINFNVFSLDAVFQWRYAPGSDIFVVWKTNIYSFGDRPQYAYFDNLRDTFLSPQTNSISLRWLYYFDLGRQLRRGGS